MYNILFLCTHNSARSIIAEAILNKIGSGRFRAFSAGSQPRGKVNPYAVEMLAQAGYDVASLSSKSWDEFEGPDAPEMHFIFTVCDSAANEVCPVWPGKPVSAHWGVPDPSSVTGSDADIRQAFEVAHARLHRRISAFVNLPLERLDAAALKQRLNEIGADALPASQNN
jgi:arsenate reductase